MVGDELELAQIRVSSALVPANKEGKEWSMNRGSHGRMRSNSADMDTDSWGGEPSGRCLGLDDEGEGPVESKEVSRWKASSRGYGEPGPGRGGRGS
ncbi:hypothetical protein NL676_010443 [Syzygium grande]|nr:hypothetical protein NL676_010443 [Syzygium grande]